jgi:lysophospholipase L1-like esterase
MRILILGDSLVFPRPKHNIRYEDTWAGILSNRGHEIFQRAKGASNISDVETETNHLMSYYLSDLESSQPFDVLILQAGINDVSPRILTPLLKKIISKIPIIRKYLPDILRNSFFYKYFGHIGTSKKKFNKVNLRLEHKFKRLAKKQIILEIAKPAHFLIKNIGDFSDNVNNYNKIYSEIFGENLLKVYKDINSSNILLPDGHHLNKIGHELIAKEILNILKDEK